MKIAHIDSLLTQLYAVILTLAIAAMAGMIIFGVAYFFCGLSLPISRGCGIAVGAFAEVIGITSISSVM